jgi:hypothetical protein
LRGIVSARGSACGRAPCAPAATIEGSSGLGAEAAHAQLQLDRDVALGAPDDAVLSDAQQRLVGELARRECAPARRRP